MFGVQKIPNLKTQQPITGKHKSERRHKAFKYECRIRIF